MKKLYLLLTAVMVAIGANATAVANPVGVTSLSNKDVLTMVQQKIETEVIIKAIKASPCTFDTFPSVMKELKRRGVPEEVLEAMIDAPYGPAAANPTAEVGDEDGPIYHYTESIKQYLTSVNTGRRVTPSSNRTRAARRNSRF
ncbi:MAG TPA: hypothetical protein VFS77_09920 [Pyrinomonadaceae bacterium]|nr:hypothetical protein [Pyrinomonadaceae bacterium]